MCYIRFDSSNFVEELCLSKTFLFCFYFYLNGFVKEKHIFYIDIHSACYFIHRFIRFTNAKSMLETFDCISPIKRGSAVTSQRSNMEARKLGDSSRWTDNKIGTIRAGLKKKNKKKRRINRIESIFLFIVRYQFIKTWINPFNLFFLINTCDFSQYERSRHSSRVVYQIRQKLEISTKKLDGRFLRVLAFKKKPTKTAMN